MKPVFYQQEMRDRERVYTRESPGPSVSVGHHTLLVFLSLTGHSFSGPFADSFLSL